MHMGEIVKSNKIREMLKIGSVKKACLFLGKPYFIAGIVVKGQQIGRNIGFPTINLDFIKQLLPQRGVYCGYVWLGEKEQAAIHLKHNRDELILPAVFNIGFRPSLETNNINLTVEAHILANFSNDKCYGKKAIFYFKERLRDEKKFLSVNLLSQQIKKDCQSARSILNIM